MDQSFDFEKFEKEFREISVAEFFEKNRHLLGYENPTKSLITIVKEAVDNSLDSAEDGRILPKIFVKVKQLKEDRYKVRIEDNGTGIPYQKIPYAFGKLLYGTKFHKNRQSRGTLGIGISGAVLYSQLTSGKPAKIVSSIGNDIHEFEIMIDVIKNEPQIISHNKKENPKKWHGTIFEVEALGRYVEGKQSILEYLKQTAISNPYAKIVFESPNGKYVFERVTNSLPPRSKEIKPHPHGIHLGILKRMLYTTNSKNLLGFLTSEFSRVGKSSALKVLKIARLNYNLNPKKLSLEEIERLNKAIQNFDFVSPPLDVLSPLGEDLIIKGLKKEVDAEFFVSISRKPKIYSGFPFLIEVGLAYGGSLPTDQQAQIIRYANKTPLLYHMKDCVTTEAVIETDWRRYGLSQSSNSLPIGPLLILIHFVSVWVPYTSEGKQAIANYPEILKETKLALQDAGRKLALYISKKRKLQELKERKSLFETYSNAFSEFLSNLTNQDKKDIKGRIEELIKRGKFKDIEEEKKEKVEEVKL